MTTAPEPGMGLGSGATIRNMTEEGVKTFWEAYISVFPESDNVVCKHLCRHAYKQGYADAVANLNEDINKLPETLYSVTDSECEMGD